MDRLSRYGDALHRRAGWGAAAAATAWSGPAMMVRGFGWPDWYALDTSDFTFALEGVLALLTLAGLCTVGRRPWLGVRSRWVTTLLPIGVAIGALATVGGLCLPFVGDWRSMEAVAGEIASPLFAPVAVMLVVFADTLRRVDLQPREVVTRAAVAASVIWLTGVLVGSLPSWYIASFAPVGSAENAACGVTEAYPSRLLAGMIATGCIGATVAVHGRAGRWRALTPLVALACWLASRTVVDVLTLTAAYRLCPGGGLAPGVASALARQVEVIGVAGYVVTFGVWVLGARRHLSTWSTVWPLLPALFLSTSAALEPPLYLGFPQQTPEAVWATIGVERITWTAESGAVPFFSTRSDDHVSGVLERGGNLHIFHGGRSAVLGPGDVLHPPSGSVGVELVIDRRATLGDLRRAGAALWRFGGVSIVWRHNELHQASAARSRWAFVEMAARALRAEHVVLATTTEHCAERPVGAGSMAARRCRLVSGDFSWTGYVVEAPDDVLIEDWLRDTREARSRRRSLGGGWSDGTPTLLVNEVAHAAEPEAKPTRWEGGPAGFTPAGGGGGAPSGRPTFRRRARAHDPVATRIRVPDLAYGAASGLALVLLMLFGGAARQRIERRRGPYRTPPRRASTASRTWTTRLAQRAALGAARWIAVAVIATASGFAWSVLFAT